MNQNEVLQAIEDVLVNARYYLIQTYTDKMSFQEAVTNIQQELEKLGGIRINVTGDNNEPQCYVLTETNWGPPAYLYKENGLYVVKMENEDETNKYTSAINALDEYIQSCQINDFISDFVVGEEKGDCAYGDNKYGSYIQKCFEKYVMQQDL